MAAMALSLVKTPETVSFGGANIVRCVLLLACMTKKKDEHVNKFSNTSQYKTRLIHIG